MPVQINSTFSERLQNIDKTEAIELYYELLSSGHSVGEILEALNSIQSTTEHGDTATAEQPRTESDEALADIASVQGRHATTQYTPGPITSRTWNERRTEPTQATESASLNEQELDNGNQRPDNLFEAERVTPATAGSQTATDCNPALSSDDQELVRPGRSRGIVSRVACGTLYAAAIASAVVVGSSIVPILHETQLTSARVLSSISGGIRTGAVPSAEARRAEAIENRMNLKEKAVDADLLRAPEPLRSPEPDPAVPGLADRSPAEIRAAGSAAQSQVQPEAQEAHGLEVGQPEATGILAHAAAFDLAIHHAVHAAAPTQAAETTNDAELTRAHAADSAAPAISATPTTQPPRPDPEAHASASAASIAAEHRIEGDPGGMPMTGTADIARAEQPDAALPSAYGAAGPTPVPRIAEIKPEDQRFKTMATDALVARGDTLFEAGDVASARLFYEHAVEAGDAVAALRLGGTFDSNFLARASIGRVQGDAAIASYWYRRARDLGNGDAEILLKKMEKPAR